MPAPQLQWFVFKRFILCKLSKDASKVFQIPIPHKASDVYSLWYKQEYNCAVTDTLGRSLKLWRFLQFGSSVPLFRMKILLPFASTSTNVSRFLSDPYFHRTRRTAFKRNLDATNNVAQIGPVIMWHKLDQLHYNCTEKQLQYSVDRTHFQFSFPKNFFL
jgi:hypothetical protein